MEPPKKRPITLSDLYIELLQIRGVVETMKALSANAELRASDHETRLRSLERWRYAMPTSLVLAVVSVVTVVLQVMTHG